MSSEGIFGTQKFDERLALQWSPMLYNFAIEEARYSVLFASAPTTPVRYEMEEEIPSASSILYRKARSKPTPLIRLAHGMRQKSSDAGKTIAYVNAGLAHVTTSPTHFTSNLKMAGLTDAAQ
jgi:hypothetical protein